MDKENPNKEKSFSNYLTVVCRSASSWTKRTPTRRNLSPTTSLLSADQQVHGQREPQQGEIFLQLPHCCLPISKFMDKENPNKEKSFSNYLTVVCRSASSWTKRT